MGQESCTREETYMEPEGMDQTGRLGNPPQPDVFEFHVGVSSRNPTRLENPPHLDPRFADGVAGEPKPIRGTFVPYKLGFTEIGRRGR